MSDTVKINGQSISMDDIQAALAEQGLDIRELAKQAKALQRGEIQNPEKKVGVSTLTFKLALVNYPDFCIERTTAKTRQLIVIMPSCKGYYVKSFKGKDEFVEELTPEMYSKLTSGMNDLELPDGFWIHTIRPGKKFCEILMRALKCESYVEMIKFNIAPKFETLHINEWSNVDSNEYVRAYKKYPQLYKEFINTRKARQLLLDAPYFVENLIADFGLNNTRDFFTQLELSLVEVDSGYRNGFSGYGGRKVYPDVEMEYKTFRDYVLYQSVFMGYAKNIGTFFSEWRDSLSMQRTIYRKIKEKYHDDLPLYHHQLSYKHQCFQERIDEAKMQTAVARAAVYQGTSGKYVFIAPKCRQDFLDEAQMQQNCLASYVKRFADGDCIIMFMRLKSDPTNSLVTIEIRQDDHGEYTVLSQKYQARNRTCTPEQSEAIDKWLKRAIARSRKKSKGEEVEVDEDLQSILDLMEE